MHDFPTITSDLILSAHDRLSRRAGAISIPVYARTDKHVSHSRPLAYPFSAAAHLVLTCEGCRAGSASSGDRVAAGRSLAVPGSEHTAAGTGRRTELALAPGEAAVVAGQLVLAVAAAAASSERPGATEPTQPNLLAAAGLALEQRAARTVLPRYKGPEPRKSQPLQVGEEEVHRLLRAAVSLNTAEANLWRYC
jgi:hypothetical protein